MVHLSVVEEQLKVVGCKFKMWGRAEIKELCQILLPGETVAMAVNGSYEAGFAMLVATDFRVLLIDKKPRYLTLRDIRFDMITELDYANSILNSTVRIYTPNRDLRFTAWNALRLRKLFTHVQHKVMETRHHFALQQRSQMGQNYQMLPEDNRQSYWSMPGTTGYDNSLSSGQDYRPIQLGQSSTDQTGRPPMYAPPIAHNEEQKRIAAAMGALGLTGAHVLNGRVVKAYTNSPFAHRWRKRPYGYSNQTS